MTEHFTREEAETWEALQIADKGRKPVAVYMQAEIDALRATTAKLKGWEAQGAVYTQSEDVSQRAFKAAQASMQHYRQTMLHALPAQPAEPAKEAAALATQGDKAYKRGFSDGMKEAPTGESWIRAIDEAMVGAHIGVAEMADDYGTAKKKLNALICWSVQVDRDLSRAQAAPAVGVPDVWKQAVMRAYGHLWHVNNEPMAPVPLYSIDSAGYEARKQLRDLLTTTERGQAINEVQAMLASAQPQQKEG